MLNGGLACVIEDLRVVKRWKDYENVLQSMYICGCTDLVALYVCEHVSGICFTTKGLLLVVAMRAPESTVHLELR